MSLIEKLGLEKCKAIVDGAPIGSLIYDLNSEKYYQCFVMYDWDVLLSDIRTAIADHERTDHCTDIRNHISPLTKVSEVKSFNQWMVDQGFNAIRHANCCRIAYEGGQQSTQAKIDELKAEKERLQKRFNFLLDKNIRDESAHASLKLRVMSVSRLMDKAAEDGTECVDIGSLYDVLIKDGDLDQALRGASDQHLNR